MCDKWCEINQKQNYDIFLCGAVDDLISIRMQMIVSSLFRLALVSNQNMRINDDMAVERTEKEQRFEAIFKFPLRSILFHFIAFNLQ